MTTRSGVILLSVVAQLSLAHAQAPTAEPSTTKGNVEAARAHFHKGKTLFDLQRYREAAAEYEAAYEAKDDPALLFNIAQAYRLAGDHAKAVGFYKSFLRNMPEAPNRAEVEARIADENRLIAEDRRTREAPPQGTEPQLHGETNTPSTAAAATTAPATSPATPELQVRAQPDSSRRRRMHVIGIGMIAGGAAAMIAGGALTGLAYQIESDQSHPGPTTTYDPSAPGRMQSEQVSGGVLLGVGAAVAIAGTVVYVLGGRR